MGGEPSSIPSVDFFGRLSAVETWITELRQRTHDQAQGLMRIEAAQTGAKRDAVAMAEKLDGLTATFSTLRETQERMAADTAALLSIVTHSKSAWGIVKKHGPRFIAFVIGLAVASGRLSPELAAQIKTLFGA